MSKKKASHLLALGVGARGTIVSIVGGWKVNKRLADLGLLPGTEIKVLKKAPYGPVEIKVRGSKLALGRGLAGKVMVK